MEEWKTEKLGEYADVISGYAFKSDSFQEKGIPIIKIANIRNGYIDLENNTQYVGNSYLSLNKKYHLKRGDILISLTGSHITQPNSVVGRVALYNHSEQSLLNQRAGKIIVKNEKTCHPLFLYYVLSTNSLRIQISSFASGAANQANISPFDVKSLKLKLPPLPTQKKIASILSAYDDLIENNQKRITILEQMAQNIYKEWFVRFRFPNYEKVEMVDGLPKDWEKKPLNEVLENFNDGDWIETKDQGGSDYRLLQVSNIGRGKFIEKGTAKYIANQTYHKINCIEIKEGNILTSRMPNDIGRSWLVTKMNFRMITSVDVAILETNDDILNKYVLIESLNSDLHICKCETMATGTTRRRISRKALGIIEHIVPTEDLQIKFEKIVKPIYELKNSLINKNKNLKKTRNRLLPRLLSGKLKV